MDQKEVLARIAAFEKAYGTLASALEKSEDLSDLEMDGAMQRFEYCLELSWKTLKSTLSYLGENMEGRLARETYQVAFSAKLIENPETWYRLLESRNKLSHTYNESMSRSIRTYVVQHYAEIGKLAARMRKRVEGAR